jgi:hypothetical protein
MKKNLWPIFLLAAGTMMYSCKKIDPSTADVNETATANTRSNNAKVGDGKDGEFCEGTTTDLMAGQHINAGNVTVSNDLDYIYVTYHSANGYQLTETHLFVGDRALLPVNNAGSAVPGQFPYSGTHQFATTYTYAVPVSAIPLGSCGIIAAHAVVKKVNANGQVIDSQTAWGKGFRIRPQGGNWAMAFNFCSCAEL